MTMLLFWLFIQVYLIFEAALHIKRRRWLQTSVAVVCIGLMTGNLLDTASALQTVDHLIYGQPHYTVWSLTGAGGLFLLVLWHRARGYLSEGPH